MALVLLIALGVVLLVTAGFVTASRRQGRRPELEPPPARKPARTRPRKAAPPPPVRKRARTRPPKSVPPAEVPDEELTPEQVAEVEEALAEAEAEAEVDAEAVAEEAEAVLEEAEEEAPARPTFRERLGKARSLFAGYLGGIRSREKITDETWDDLEEALIRADVGIDASTAVLDDLRGRVKKEGISDPDQLVAALKADLVERLEGDPTLKFEPGTLNVWLFVGVNGVGKTTTIGKVGRQSTASGRSVIMAAGDTFRAAAAEQLQLWAKRVGADLVRGAEGGDPGAVVFDAKQRGAAKGVDLVLADTAGRLHTKVNLMEELKKVRRVAEREPGVLNEVLLVIDATTGQNGLVQAKQFMEAVGVTGVVLTKLDGTAKGGIAVAIREQLGLPIKLVGLGEGPDDLIEFDAKEFVEAIFG